jgi:hypothetical protein
MGNIPHVPAAKLSAGNQTFPVKKLKPASPKKGTPWLKTKTIIKKIAKIDEIAHTSKINWMKRSPAALVPDLRSVRTAVLDVARHSFAKKKGGRGYLEVMLLLLSLLSSRYVVVAVVVAAAVAVYVGGTYPGTSLSCTSPWLFNIACPAGLSV